MFLHLVLFRRALFRSLGAVLVLVLASVLVAAAPGGSASGAANGTADVVRLRADPAPLAVGETSGWITVHPESIILGALTVEAPAHTRIVAADADVRPYAGVIADDGKSVTWSGRTTWVDSWRIAKFKLAVDADAPVPAVERATMRVVEDGGSTVLAEGEYSLAQTVAFTADVPPMHAGQTSDWIDLVPGRPVLGALEVTAPAGTRIVAADARIRPCAGIISDDGRTATWPDRNSWSDTWRVPRIKLTMRGTVDGARTSGRISVVEVGGTGAQLASGTFEAVDPGPRPSSIEVSADGSSSEVLVHGLGSAAEAQARELRSYRHSDLQPTGRFVRKGQHVVVTVPDGAPAMSVRVGLYGTHEGLEGSSLSSARATPVGTTEFDADRDGMVFAQSTAPDGSAVVEIAGGDAVPTFVLGQTTNESFRRQLSEAPDAPMFELVSGRVFGDFQRRSRASLTDDVERLMQDWDDVVSITDEMHGLRDDFAGRSWKAPHRVYIASPDTSGGYANAAHERITFQVGTGAAGEALGGNAKDKWGLWHEVGHTYQTPAYNWSGQGEVAVNISSIEVANRLGVSARLDGSEKAVRSFFAKPVEERRYTSADLWVRLLMYDQLRRAFGDQFYPRLNRELRTALALQEASTPDNQAKIDLFAGTAARVADRDLTPFFREWGLPVGDDVEREMATRPALSVDIWENVLSNDTRVEHELPAVGHPLGHARVDETVVVGQRRLLDPPVVTELGSTDGKPVSVGTATLDAPAAGTGSAWVELRHPDGAREALPASVDVSPGNSVEFRGIGDHTIAWLALLDAGHELRVLPGTGAAAHDYWGAEEYIGFELRSADDEHSLGDWSVRGNANAHELAASFRQQWEDGQILVVRHQEPSSRLTAFVDGDALTRVNAKVQRFRIVGGSLVRDDGVVTPVTIESPEDGADTPARPEVRGHGEPGAAVELSVKSTGTVIGCTTVDRDGRWTITADRDLAGKGVTLVATQTAP